MIELFKRAAVEYNDLIKELKVVGDTLEAYQKDNGKKFSSDIFLKQFDCIFQYGLLQHAIADGTLDKNELIFIKEITSYGDLLVYINSYYKNSVTWDDVLNAKEDSVDKWLSNNEEYINKLSAEFIASLAMVDAAVTNVDFVKMLIEKCGAIYGLLEQMDGEVSKAEQNDIPSNYLLRVIAVLDKHVKELLNK